MYDAIIIGARCAGSATAMLLARKGYKVLLLDKATFPSDTVSTHIILLSGLASLHRWGLLDQVIATGCTPIETMLLDVGAFALSGSAYPMDGIATMYAPRRILLDKILLDAAVLAGAELRQGCAVEQIIGDGDQVTGVRCHTRGGASVTERARIVIGADGRNSLVARTVNAEKYNILPPMTTWYYTYWSGVDITALSYYMPPGRAIGFIPTNDGQLCIPICWGYHEFHEYRSDVEGNYMKTFDLVPKLADMMRTATREDRFYGMAELPGFFRKAYGPGWVLVGDAGYHKDPITGQGISDAFKSAEAVAEAIDAGFSGRAALDAGLERYVSERDASSLPMYQLTAEWASLQPPPPEQQEMLFALQDNARQLSRFFGAVAGSVPIPEFFSEENIADILASAQV